MNRSRSIQRNFAAEGSQRSQELALALAQIADPELLEALVHHIGALHEFGGELYIGTARDRFEVTDDDQLVKVREGGSFITYAHVIAYNKRSRVKGQALEPDASYESQAVPSLDVPEAEDVGPGPERVAVAAGE